ncbi:MAG: DUF1848 family protein [Desulfosarcina sp.]
MKQEQKQILSVSRRTDIPAFYMSWFMEQVARGSIDVENPFNRQVRSVAVSPDRIHSIVFWSKNFRPFLRDRCGERLRAMGYHLFFNFTINSRSPILEPVVPDLGDRIDQLHQLCGRFGAASVQWRFDPVCHFVMPTGVAGSNLDDFEPIAEAAGKCGIRTCTTSFMDHYGKVARRSKKILTFVEPPVVERLTILLEMEQRLSPLGIQLAVCCEKPLLERLSAGSTITAGACISGHRITALHGGRVSLKRDAGQRRQSGCGCTVSVDVGSYRRHPCHHNCLFCYANPACDRRSAQ